MAKLSSHLDTRGWGTCMPTLIHPAHTIIRNHFKMKKHKRPTQIRTGGYKEACIHMHTPTSEKISSVFRLGVGTENRKRKSEITSQ